MYVYAPSEPQIRSASQRCDYELPHNAPDPCVTPAVKNVAMVAARHESQDCQDQGRDADKYLMVPYGTSRRLRGVKSRMMVETGTGEFFAVASPLGGTMKPVLNI